MSVSIKYISQSEKAKYKEFSHHTLDVEHMTIMSVVFKIFGDVSKVWEFFGVLTGTVYVFNAMLANNALALDVNELNADVGNR